MQRIDINKDNHNRLNDTATMIERAWLYLLPLMILIPVVLIIRQQDYSATISTGIQILMVFTVYFTIAIRRHISPLPRISIYCLALIIMGFIGLMQWGLLGIGINALLLGSIIAATAHKRLWWILTAISISGTILIGVAFMYGKLIFSLDAAAYMRTPSTWFVAYLVFIPSIFATLLWNQMYNRLMERTIALHKSEEKYATVVENSKDAIIIHHLGTIKFVNDATVKLFGYSKGELLGSNIMNYIHPDHVPDTLKRLDELNSGKAIDELIEITIKKKDGNFVSAELNIAAISFQGKPSTLVFLRDISIRKQAENAIRSLNETLEQYVRERTTQLETANKNLQEFAYVISHDLKAPLRSISQLANWLTTDYENVLDDNGKEYLNLLTGRVHRLNRLIDGILQYSRLGQTTISPTTIDLNLLVADVITALAPPEGMHIHINSTLPTVTADEIRIIQIFQNLINNAIKHHDKTTGHITIDSWEHECHFEFAVTDDGPGIDPKYHDRIFKIFQTLVPRDELEATGIGLTLVKRIVELHHGAIWVESKVGQGSSFHFTLPKLISELPVTTV